MKAKEEIALNEVQYVESIFDDKNKFGSANDY